MLELVEGPTLADRIAAAIVREPQMPLGSNAEHTPDGARVTLDRLLAKNPSDVSGHGHLVLLGGEAGIGKTRLAEELLAEARQEGCLALTGRCYETESTAPFIPWVEVVERSAHILPPAAFQKALGDGRIPDFPEQCVGKDGL